MSLDIPAPLTAEHEALHAQLVAATRLPGKTGDAARAVEAILMPHFRKEEEAALPVLGLLKMLATNGVTHEAADAIVLADKLKADLPKMLAEHRSIVEALERLVTAAREEGRPEVARFAHELIHHAQMEEDILYPAAIIVGAYVRQALDQWE